MTSPPPNTEDNRRELAWAFIDSTDSKVLHHTLADLLCGDWKGSDDRFNDWWRSVHDTCDAECLRCGTPVVPEKNEGFYDGRHCRDCEAAMIGSFPGLLEALRGITRCVSIPGPAGTTAYIVNDELMRQGRAAVAKALPPA